MRQSRWRKKRCKPPGSLTMPRGSGPVRPI
jgi:hypothetical protein